MIMVKRNLKFGIEMVFDIGKMDLQINIGMKMDKKNMKCGI